MKRTLLILKIGALGIIYCIFVMLTGFSISCPIRAFTGGRIKCPSCGISRMCISMVKLEFHDAFRYNPAIFLLIPIWTLCIGLWIFEKGGRFIKIIEIISIIILIGFGIVRNIV
ncbi:MAG: DUF2752 domain-containing protein [Ruminococcus sp.]|nr:DUF2752 domain-containing protein [Ruminococcus sp.]